MISKTYAISNDNHTKIFTNRQLTQRIYLNSIKVDNLNLKPKENVHLNQQLKIDLDNTRKYLLEVSAILDHYQDKYSEKGKMI